MDKLHWTEVDGVPTVWADVPGPLNCGLYFRAGRADETLPASGRFHLIEHLALSSVEHVADRRNGFIDGSLTGFMATGRPDELGRFLLDVCRALSCLPGEHLGGEKQVMDAERATSGSNHPSVRLLTCRYGVQGYGLLGAPEFGQRSATIEDLRTLAEQEFTRDNAILWLSGPPPSGLALPLPDGRRRADHRLESILQPACPSWFVADDIGGIATGSIVPRDSAGSPFRIIASRRLRDFLRQEHNVSYSPWVSYEPLNADVAHLAIYADSDQDHRAEMAGLFGELFEALTNVEEEEAEAAVAQLCEQLTGSLAPSPERQLAQELQRAAYDSLLGWEHQSLEQLAAEAREVTADDISRFAAEVQSMALFALPGTALLRPSMGKEVPICLCAPAEGRAIRMIDSPVRRDVLILSPEGVTIREHPDAEPCTVRYENLAAMLRFEDGCLHLIGLDGAIAIIEPTLWREGLSICREIANHVPSQLLVEQGARNSQDIPRPHASRSQRLIAWFQTRPTLPPRLQGAVFLGVGAVLAWWQIWIPIFGGAEARANLYTSPILLALGVMCPPIGLAYLLGGKKAYVWFNDLGLAKGKINVKKLGCVIGLWLIGVLVYLIVEACMEVA